MNKEQREQLASDLLAEAEHRRGRVVDLLRNAAAALSTTPTDLSAKLAHEQRQPTDLLLETLEQIQASIVGQLSGIAVQDPETLNRETVVQALTQNRDRCHAALSAHARAVLSAPPAAEVPAGHHIQVCKLGRFGAAYDPTGTHYAYTYSDQPDNVAAMKLGRAAATNATKSHGDGIDRGLHLLLVLQAEGFGVFQIDTNTPPVSEQQKADAYLLRLIDQHRIELLPEYDAGYIARAYSDQLNPVAEAVAMTARAALEELAKRLNPHLAQGVTEAGNGGGE